MSLRLPPLPLSAPPAVPHSELSISRACRDGFYSCRRCYSVTTLIRDGVRVCFRCNSPVVKFHPGLNS